MDLFNSDADDEEPSNDNDPDHSRLGRYAEFLVCADITQNGYYAIHADYIGFDIILVDGHKTYRVQVKSSSVIRRGLAEWRCRINKNSHRGNEARKRELDRRDADILALYHHDLATITYLPVLHGCGRLQLPVSQVRQTPTAQSLGDSISWCDKTPISFIPEGIAA